MSQSPRFLHYFFGYNFDDSKIYVVFTYFFRCNFSGWNFDVISTMQCISLFLLIFLTFLFLFSRRFSCVFNFEQLTFARLFPLKFSSGPLPLKFVSFLQNLPFQKELLQVNFQCIYRTATLPNNFYIAMKLLL